MNEKWIQVNRGFVAVSSVLGLCSQELLVYKKQEPNQTNVNWKK